MEWERERDVKIKNKNSSSQAATEEWENTSDKKMPNSQERNLDLSAKKFPGLRQILSNSHTNKKESK